MGIYKKEPYSIGADTSVLQCGRVVDKIVKVKPALPGNVILIHGVNDVGVSYDQVEAGLCAGLGDRLAWGGQFQSASYRMPKTGDLGRLEVDPDAVFFKRQLQAGNHTPVIPFYWGYRESVSGYKTAAETKHGQAVDRYGNRLDKDMSKGGGPFANATTTLVDMWNRGFGSPWNLADSAASDPLRPVLKAPGRMYMVLAAKRLAALIAMIRDYDENETVSLVAHSQGCMLSLLAQAFLMQEGLRPADTLVLTHPPYSLVDDIPWLNDAVGFFSGGEDAPMADHYGSISDIQTLNARLQTLANIVQGVVTAKHSAPAFAALKDPAHHGVVGCEWQASQDRDNRGKVYLYFSPEDMTVALNNIQGIGWQGVPDFAHGSKLSAVEKKGPLGGRQVVWQPVKQTRQALKELGAGFFQRVFTARLRTSRGAKQPGAVLVGAIAPYDFALRIDGEDDHAHAASGSTELRAHSAEVTWPPEDRWLGMIPKPDAVKRDGIRTITGERLKRPVKADMYAGAVTLPGQPKGAHEAVDPIDAAISVTSDYGLLALPPKVIADPRPVAQRLKHSTYEFLPPSELAQIATLLNQGKPATDSYSLAIGRYIDGQQIEVSRRETPNEARLRQQGSMAPRSFHGAIFGSAKNHRQVTAYDIAIGGGQAVSDPKFYGYLCAVADWRLKEVKSGDVLRPGILEWATFEATYASFYGAEPKGRKDLIRASCLYYSTGVLPPSLPVLPANLPPPVVSETSGKRMAAPVTQAPVKKADAAPLTMGEWLAQNPAPDDGPREVQA